MINLCIKWQFVGNETDIVYCMSLQTLYISLLLKYTK